MYMTRKIKIVEVYNETPEPTNEDEPTTQEAQTNEEEHPQASTEVEAPITKQKKMLDMPTTTKTLEQVECKACNRRMSAKTLKYNHAKYCAERVLEERPVDIPVPQVQLDNETLKTKKQLIVKNLKLEKTEKVASNEVQQPTIPPQTPAMDQSFHYQMAQRLRPKSAKYEAMMSNAF